MERYDDRYDSGIEWIGTVPSHWIKTTVKNGYNTVLGKMLCSDRTSNADTIENYMCAANIKWLGVNTNVSKQMWFSPVEKAQYLLRDGDVLVMEGGMAGTACVYHNEFEPCYIQNSVHKCTAKGNNNNRFLYYWLFASYHAGYVDSICNKATIQHYTGEKLANTPMILPPIDEQSAIADYLDRKVSHIDNIIAEARASIEEYKAWKASIIYEAVTKGLDKGVEMKDSGVEWIGKTPIHWDACALKQLTTKIGSGKTPSGGAEVYSDTGVIFLRSQNVYNTGLVLEDVSHISEEIDAEMKNTRVQYEDVLLNITGGSIGRCCLFDLVDTPANVNQHVCILRTDRAKLLPQFLRYFWNSASGPMVVDQYQTGGNRQGLNFEQIGMTKIPLCSIAEQQTIIDYLDRTTRDINSLISEKESLISDLEAYKKSLIFEVVTGKRKVYE